MKNGFLLAITAFGALCLSACSIFDFMKKDEDGSDNTPSSGEKGDSTIYGTGADNLTLTDGSGIPAGEYVAGGKAPESQPDSPITAGFLGVYQRSVSPQNMVWEDDFQTTSMCKLKDGQVVNLKYATLQNINSNPQIGALKNGTFKVGVHIKTTNGVLKVKANGQSGMFSSTGGQAIFRSELSDSSYFSNDYIASVNNLQADEEKEFIHVPDGIYLQLNSAEIIQ